MILKEHWKSVNIQPVLDWSEWLPLTEMDGKLMTGVRSNLNLEKNQVRSIYYNGNGGTGARCNLGTQNGDNFSFQRYQSYTLDGWLDQETGWMSKH